MIISFSGASGVGKSSLLSAFEKRLKSRKYKTLKHKEDDFLFMKILRGGKELGVKSTLTATMYKKRKMSMKETCFVYSYALLILLESWFVYFYYTYFERKTILLKDRYAYDYLITLEENYRLKSDILRKLYLLFPKSELNFVIDSDFTTLTKRNRKRSDWLEHSGAHKNAYTKILKSYRNLAEEKNLILMNNSDASVEESTKHALQAFLVKQNLKSTRSVYLMGIDGTGKSTLSNNLIEYVEKLGFNSKIVHFYHNSLLYRFLLWLGVFKKQKETKKNFAKNRERAVVASKKGKSFLWAVFHFSDGVFQSIMYRFLHPNSVLIFDRCLHDFTISFEHYRVPFREVFTKVLPRHKNALCLICSPETSYKRKPENSKEFFEQAHHAYKKMARTEKIKKLDTDTNDADQVFDLVLEYLSNRT